MLQNPELHYLDNAATTMVAPEVADVIDKAMREHWANPSSLYGPGARSEEALNAARAAVARTLGCKPKELYFTSCGSESNNLALLGAVRTRTFGKGIVVSGFEHPSVSARWKSWRSRATTSRWSSPARTAHWISTKCWSMWTRTPSSWPA